MEYLFDVGVSICLEKNPDEDKYLKSAINSSIKYLEVFYADYYDDPEWIKSALKHINTSKININSMHAPFSKEIDISRIDGGHKFAIDKILKVLALAKQIGAGILVIHGSSEPIEDDRPQRIAQCKQSLNILSNEASKLNIRLALELLPRTCLGNTAEELELLLDGIPEENVGFCLDTNHHRDPSQLNEIVQKLGKKIITLHISDYDGIDEKHWMPFKGVINWGDFVNALGSINYSGAFIYEINLLKEGNIEEIIKNFQKIIEIANSQR
ncbi:MAG: sugar phosphate isomerase/epimerase family protein [bacterium]